MTAQPDMTGFGRPPAAPSGFRKFAPFIASAATGGAIVAIALYLMQTGLPTHLTPGYVAGTMAGSETLGHLQTSGDEQISYEVRSQAAQQALGISTQAMQGAATVANTADFLCGASRIAENLAAQESASRSALTSDAAWWQGFFGRFGASTCGVGTEIRNGIIGEVTSNGRQSGILSVRDLRELPPEKMKNVQQALSIMHSQRHYSDREFGQAKAFYKQQSPAIQNALTEGLKADDLTSQDTFTERTFTFASLTSNH